MKKYSILLLALISFSLFSFAQEKRGVLDDGIEDEIKEELQQNIPNESRDRLIFEFTHDNWLNKPDNVDLRWYNRGFNTYVMYDISLGEKGNVGFAPGVGISANNVYYNGRMLYDDSLDQVYFEKLADELDINTNKIGTTFLEVPLELRLRTNPDRNLKRWKLALGLRGGYLLNGHTKYKGQQYAANGGFESVKVKDLRIPSISKYRLGTSLRLGYGNFNIIGYLALTPFFERDRGPDIQQFSIGFSFNSF